MKDILDYIDVYRAEAEADLCDRIVETLGAHSPWREATVGEGDLRADYRKCEALPLREWPNLDNEMFSVVGRSIINYRSNHPFADVSDDTGYNVLRYGVGSFYREHVDSYDTNPRVVSCSIALNDDFEGGEFAFFGGEKLYRLNKGDVLMFPSNFLYPHQILPVTNGTRYSIVTWLI